MPELTQEEIVTLLKGEIAKAQDVADTESAENERMYKRYRAKTMDNEEAGRSQIVDTTVFETIEWVMPALEDIFSEENGIPEFEPQGPEDEMAAEAMTELCRYQFWRQSDAVIPFRLAMKKGLLFRPGGILKYCWEKDVSSESKRWEEVSPEELMMMEQNPEAFQVQRVEVGDTGATVEGVERSIEYDGPRFYSVPDGEFLRHPNARDIKTSPFVAHKTRVTADYLRRKEAEGIFSGVGVLFDEHGDAGNQASENIGGEVTLAQQDKLGRDPEHSNDPARKEFLLYECYVQMDTDGDGLLENRVICLVNDHIIRNEINPYKYPPFVKLCAIDDIDKFSGITVAEMVEDIQKLRTFLLRQMVDNMAQANNSRKVYDPTLVNQADILDNRVGVPIRVQPGVDVRTALMELVTQPFNPVTFSVLEYATALAEQRTGVNKSSKGVGDQFNETFSGQMAALNQASQRIRMIAKIMATGMGDLFRAMVYMNKKFLTRNTYVRLENKFLEVSPDDLEGKMDLTVHVIMGQASRQQTLVNMQQLLATLGQLAQVGVPALDAKVSGNIVREMVKSMGYKNVERFLPEVFLNNPNDVSQLMTANTLMGGGASGGGGGQTIGSLASAGTGAGATTNPGGAGLPASAIQPGAG